MNDRLPFTIDRYQVTERVGAGSMGVVYKGFDPLIGRPVAIKVIRTDLDDDGDRKLHRDRFLHEVRAAGRCIHPGIVTIFDYAERDDDRYIVMEHLDGVVLQRLLVDGPLPVERGLDVALQLLDALGHAHAQGVVHRDVKPSNIIVGPAGRVKITDFGVARANTGGLTYAGMLMGTPHYMAPEQARCDAVDHRADLFAVGILLLRMLTGVLPHGGDSFASVLQKVAAPEPVDVSALGAVAPDLAAIAALALEKNPAERFQSAEEFAGLLRTALSNRPQADLWPGMDVGEGAPPADDPAGAPRDPPSDAAAPTLTSVVPSPSAAPGDAPVPAPPFTPTEETLRGVEAILARFIGPIARIVVRRSAARCPSLDGFGAELATSIEERDDRGSFEAAFAALTASQRGASHVAPGLPATPPP